MVAIKKMTPIFRKYNPDAPFNYQFASDEYSQKFGEEERIGQLGSVFATPAIFISCLGLFGLAAFMAEQRTKEVGVRKVLGASVFSLWMLLSKDFMVLVFIAFSIATPIAGFFLNNRLEKFSYHTDFSWWVFAVSGAGVMMVTVLTVSFQSIKAALMNPVKSLHSD